MRLAPKSRLSLHGLRRRTFSLSAVQGPLHPELNEKTLPHYFASEILQQYSSRPALTCRREGAYSLGGPKPNNLNVDTHLAWDFSEFDRAINAYARGLLEMGVVKGDRVGVLMGNNSAYAILQWACASIGAILTTINPAYRVGELVNVLNLVGVKHLVVVPRIRTSHYIQLLTDKFPSLKHSAPGNIQEEGLPALRNIIVVDNEEVHREELRKLDIKTLIDWREVPMWREDNSSWNRRYKDIVESLHNDDIANIQFTSGTTGSPKAVTLTHRNLLNNSLSIGRRMHLTERDVVCNVPPLFHCFDEYYLTNDKLIRCSRLVLGNLAAWVHGACIVYPSAIFDPPSIVDSIPAERCTALHGVPTHFLGVLKEIEARREQGEEVDTRTLRTGIAAGSPIPIQLMKRLISEMNLKELTNAYGMTETSPVSFQTVPEDPLMKRVETVGRILPHVKAKIINYEGNTVPVNTPGELCVSGYLVQKGYWNDEEQTRSVMQKDDSGVLWMHTGDQGILDEQGYLSIVGRIKDIIIRGGENLFPVQIENALTTHPGILEAAAISVPNEKYGEVVGVWIVRAEGHEALRETQIRALVSDTMNPQNAPAWVWFTEELPKTASGKIMKHVLRDRGRELARSGEGRSS